MDERGECIGNAPLMKENNYLVYVYMFQRTSHGTCFRPSKITKDDTSQKSVNACVLDNKDISPDFAF